MRGFLFFLILCGGAYAGYRYLHRSDSAGTGKAPAAMIAQTAAAAAGETPADPKTGTPMVSCTRCRGTGTIKCTAPRDVDGWVDCPGKCLKLSVGRWEHMDVPGHDATELWQKFTFKGGHSAWSTAHVGQVIEIRDGKPVNIGECPVCHGKAKVPCKVCQGTGQVTCPVCRGEKFIPVRLVKTPTPASVQGTPAPLQTRDDAIQLKDGTTLHGQVVVNDPDAVWIRQLNGGTVKVPKNKLLKPRPLSTKK